MIGSYAFTFTFAQIQDLAYHPRPEQTFGGIQYNYETPLLTDGDASYKLYFDIFTRFVTQGLPTQ